MATILTATKVLTSKGYAVLKTSISTDELDKIRKELTMSPIVLTRYAGAAGSLSFPIYQESPSRLYVPRKWGLLHFGPPEIDIVPEGLCLPYSIQFTGKPFAYQEVIIQSFMNKGANGIICIPCGRGKTFIAIYLAILIGKRFLIVVDKEFLMNQWKEELCKFASGIRVGILQGPVSEIDPEKYDCTICMIQTICNKDFTDKFFGEYGFTIFDECHHLGAQHFSGTLRKIQTRYMLGLSATPERDDGMTKVFEHFLGESVYRETREPDPTVAVRAVWYKNDDDDYTKEPTDWRGELVIARLMTQITGFRPRTDRIIEIVKDLASNAKRKILVLSERREHLREIHNVICGTSTYTCGFYIGGMKQEELNNNAQNCQILFGTYAMASEAMNIKALNTMVMASPRKKVEQSTGRILRVSASERTVDPLIVDIVDQHEIYIRQWYQRQRYYTKCEYSIKYEGRCKPIKTELDNEIQSRCMIKC